jgi:hypothetical protein
MHPSRCVLLIAGLLLARVAAAAPGLVVAVDTSRSLQPSELAAATTLAADTLGTLTGRPDTSVVAFEDAPRWVVSPGKPPAAAAGSLAGLTPRGDYTLLHDALFVAVRSLDEGGAVLLLTDGRDENSATTLEDVARLCELNGVRVLAVGAGRRVEERALRRLALLTGGAYLGRVSDVRPDLVANATREALSAAAAPSSRRRAAPAPHSPVGGAEAAAAGGAVVPAAVRQVVAPASAAPSGPPDAAAPARWWLLGLPVALLLVAPVAVWAVRRPRSPRASWCRRCGAEYTEGDECPQCSEVELQQRLRNRDVTRLEDTAELRIDPQALAAAEAAGDPDRMEKTRVLTDQSILVVHEPNERHRSFLLRADGAFAVGRDPHSNTLSLRDPALSAHHFKVVPEEGLFYLVDLESTNGTFVNQRRVRAQRLASGDVIRAGQVELEFRTCLGGVA